MNHPLLLIVMTAAGLFVGKLWYDDLRSAQQGRRAPAPLPGAFPASRRTVEIAVLGALALLALETAGEHVLGIVEQQNRLTWLFATYSVFAAPIIEETIFRGWMVSSRLGRFESWFLALAASFAFTLLHPFLWRWDEDGFTFTLTIKGWFSSAAVFSTSLWLYAVRLSSWNPQQSLLPCFVAHAARNAGVIAIKANAGYIMSVF